MTDTKPTLEEQIAGVKYLVETESKLGNSYWSSVIASLKELQNIKLQPVPVEPVINEPYWLRGVRNGKWPLGNEVIDHIDSLKQQLQVAERNVRIERLKNKGTLANNLCPDHRDKQQGQPCLACIIEKLTKQLQVAQQELEVQMVGWSDCEEKLTKAENVCICGYTYAQHTYDKSCDSHGVCPNRQGVFRNERQHELIQKLDAENSELRKDAERYRWQMENPAIAFHYYKVRGFTTEYSAEIDRARSAND